MKRLVIAARKFGLFATSIGLLAVTSLWFVRSAIEVASLSVWGSVAVGQAIGAIGAVLVGYGWNLTGPVQIASASLEGRRTQYSTALITRALLLVAVAGMTAVALLLFQVQNPLITMLGALPVMTIALSGSFYFVGTAQPSLLLLTETIPRVVLTSLASVAMSTGVTNVIGGLLLQLVGSAVAIAVSALYILRGRSRSPIKRGLSRRVRHALETQSGGLLASFVVMGVSNAPLLIVSGVAPAALPTFSVVDKLGKQILAGSSPVTAVLQGWVPRAGQAEIRNRARAATAIAWLAGISVAVIVAAISVPALEWLTAGEYTPSTVTALLMGLFVGLFLTQNALSFAVLAALGLIRQVNRSLLITSPLGLLIVVIAAPAHGTDGALAGVCIGMLLTCGWQTACGLRGTRRR